MLELMALAINLMVQVLFVVLSWLVWMCIGVVWGIGWLVARRSGLNGVKGNG